MHDMTANLAKNGQNYGNSGCAKNVSSGNPGGYDANRNDAVVSGFISGKEIVCQIRFTPGHGTYKFKNRLNQGFIPRNRKFRGFRPRGGQNFRGFACFNQNVFWKRLPLALLMVLLLDQILQGRMVPFMAM